MSSLENLDPDLTLKDYLKDPRNKGTDKNGETVFITFDDFKKKLENHVEAGRETVKQLAIVNPAVASVANEILKSREKLLKNLEPSILLTDAVKMYPGNQQPLDGIDSVVIGVKKQLGLLTSSDAQIIAEVANEKYRSSNDPETIQKNPAFAERLKKDSHELVYAAVV